MQAVISEEKQFAGHTTGIINAELSFALRVHSSRTATSLRTQQEPHSACSCTPTVQGLIQYRNV